MVEKRILPLSFVGGMDMYLCAFAWLLEDVGSVSSDTKAAVLWMCHLVTDLRAVKHMVFRL